MTKYSYPWIIMLIIVMAFSACDNSLDPLDKDKGGYSLYGYLNLYKDVNYIRVKNLNTSLEQDTTGEIDAEVTFENLDNGLTETLEDTIVEFEGIETHNFKTTLDIRPETKYRVEVKRSDGKITSATATTPPIAETDVDPIGANCITQFDLSFEPVQGQLALQADIGFSYEGKIYWVRANRFLYESGEKVIISVTPFRILEGIFAAPPGPNGSYQEGEVFCHELDNDTFDVRYTHYGPDLFTNTISDTLQIPGGAGRFGALYRDSFSFKIDTTRLCPPLPFEECL